jgi:hypothetical protein
MDFLILHSSIAIAIQCGTTFAFPLVEVCSVVENPCTIPAIISNYCLIVAISDIILGMV